MLEILSTSEMSYPYCLSSYLEYIYPSLMITFGILGRNYNPKDDPVGDIYFQITAANDAIKWSRTANNTVILFSVDEVLDMLCDIYN